MSRRERTRMRSGASLLRLVIDTINHVYARPGMYAGTAGQASAHLWQLHMFWGWIQRRDGEVGEAYHGRLAELGTNSGFGDAYERRHPRARRETVLRYELEKLADHLGAVGHSTDRTALAEGQGGGPSWTTLKVIAISTRPALGTRRGKGEGESLRSLTEHRPGRYEG
jgi:hypothetical protein